MRAHVRASGPQDVAGLTHCLALPCPLLVTCSPLSPQPSGATHPQPHYIVDFPQKVL